MWSAEGPRIDDAGADGADAVELALAGALKAAADAGRWDVVERLARELQARCIVREGVVANALDFRGSGNAPTMLTANGAGEVRSATSSDS